MVGQADLTCCNSIKLKNMAYICALISLVITAVLIYITYKAYEDDLTQALFICYMILLGLLVFCTLVMIYGVVNDTGKALIPHLTILAILFAYSAVVLGFLIKDAVNDDKDKEDGHISKATMPTVSTDDKVNRALYITVYIVINMVITFMMFIDYRTITYLR